MWLVKWLLLGITTVVLAWNPVRPGALIQDIGKLMIVDESVRVFVNFANVSHVGETISEIEEGLKLVKSHMYGIPKNTSIQTRLEKKYNIVMHSLSKLKENFVKPEREKRAAITGGLVIGGLLAVTGLGMYAELSNRFHKIEKEMDKVEDLTLKLTDITITVAEITEAFDNLQDRHITLYSTMDIYMLLDQIFIKLTEMQAELATFIQDLVLANSGQVTSTLLTIPQLVKIIQDAKYNWNFNPFFSTEALSMYYPLLTSYLNGTTVIIDIPFSSDSYYELYEIIAFPMLLNNSIYTVETEMVKPNYYLLSDDSLMESTIVHDDLMSCKKGNTNLYLCPAHMFTVQKALTNSCEASLIRNVSVIKNCFFTKVESSKPQHVNIHDTHYIFFNYKTKVSLTCPGVDKRVATVYGMYSVPDMCELHSEDFSTIADKQNILNITKETILFNIKFSMHDKLDSIKIRKLKDTVNVTRGSDHSLLYYTILVPIAITAILCSIGTYCYCKHAKKPLESSEEMPTIQHVSSTSPMLS